PALLRRLALRDRDRARHRRRLPVEPLGAVEQQLVARALQRLLARLLAHPDQPAVLALQMLRWLVELGPARALLGGRGGGDGKDGERENERDEKSRHTRTVAFGRWHYARWRARRVRRGSGRCTAR